MEQGEGLPKGGGVGKSPIIQRFPPNHLILKKLLGEKIEWRGGMSWRKSVRVKLA